MLQVIDGVTWVRSDKVSYDLLTDKDGMTSICISLGDTIIAKSERSWHKHDVTIEYMRSVLEEIGLEKYKYEDE
jgi:hypothetical protein